jgi:hypothetical protein
LLPSVAVKWLTLLFCIREILGSNLGLETGYPDWGVYFSWGWRQIPVSEMSFLSRVRMIDNVQQVCYCNNTPLSQTFWFKLSVFAPNMRETKFHIHTKEQEKLQFCIFYNLCVFRWQKGRQKTLNCMTASIPWI